MIRLALGWAAAAAAMMLAAGQGTAQPAPRLGEAMAAGVVGERFDGYLGFASTPSDAVRRQVNSINIRRRNLYTALAARRGVTVRLAGVATGCTLLSRVPVGGAYMLQDMVWRQRQPGQAELKPEHCRS